MLHVWQHLVADGMLKDLTAVAVAHVCAVPHFVIWIVRRRRKNAAAAVRES